MTSDIQGTLAESPRHQCGGAHPPSGTDGAAIDARTLIEAQKGDVDALVAILQHHDARLRLIAGRLLGDRSLMDDALQEVAIKAARALPKLRVSDSLGVWLSRTTYRTCIDMLRRRRRLVFMAPENLPAAAESEGSLADDLSARDIVTRALQKLSPEQRIAVLLVDQEGLDYKTAAGILGIPTGTVASRLSVARAALRHELAPLTLA